MDLNFKKFENTKQRLEPRITVTKSAAFGFPTKFYRDNHIKDYKYVVIYYDEAETAIGLHFTNDETEKGKFSIIHSDNYGGNIVARSFFNAFNLKPEVYHGRYEWEKKGVEGVGEVFVFKLKERVIQ